MEGERNGYHKRPTCALRERWYDLGNQQPPAIIWFKAFNDRVLAPLNSLNFHSSDRFYAIYLRKTEQKEKLSYALNSTLAHLFVEIWGRVNLGEGALDNMTYETSAMYTLNPLKMTAKHKEPATYQQLQLHKAFEKISMRPVESIFSELGAFSPEEVTIDKVKTDRRELDRIIMGEILGLSDEEQLEVYRAVIDLVKSRIERARSLGNRKKTKEGIDIDLLVKTILEKVGDDTLGKFYLEKVLNQKSLYTKELLKTTEQITTKKSLFGWQLHSSKEYVDCSSESEARYLKVWAETGMEKIEVPSDEEYLKTIVPELESLKAKIDTVIEDHLSFIANIKTREKILHLLWQEINNGAI